MFSNKTLYHWKRALATAFATFSKPQTQVLALFSAGVALARSCTLARVAESLWWLGRADSVERRLQRFLASPQVDWQAGCRCLAHWVLGSLVSPRGLVVLLVDETTLADHFKVMAVSLAYQGRAIPLAWWCYHQDHYPMAQNKLIDTLFGWIAPALRPGWQVLVQADRGLSNSPTLLRLIEKRGWFCLVRVQRDLRLGDEPAGPGVRFGELLTRPGQEWSGWVHVFMRAGGIHCRALAYWGKGHQAPWLLLTNYPPAQAPWYGWRMWEELAFRDFKSAGWQWQKSRVWKPEHANRLWLVLALAYAWMLSLGTQGALREVRPQLVRGRGCRRSLFALGLRLLHRARELFGKILHAFDFVFVSQAPPSEKTVVQ
ncbi:MAG: transposase family protein [Pedosphaera sp.]|nr:transposase family protein [Pedosphaera sp.]